MKEISADAKNPRLKMFLINGLFLGVRVVAALQAFVFMMGLLFANINSHSHASLMQAKLCIDKRCRLLVRFPLLRKSAELKGVRYRENKITDCERRGIRCH